MKLKGLSPSRISTYNQCVFKYFLNYHLKTELKSNYGAANGTLIHAIMDRFASNQDRDWMQQLYTGFAGELEVINNFDKKEKLKSPLVYAKAEAYQEIKPHCDVCPFADLKNNQCRITKHSIDNLVGCPKKLFEESIDLTRQAIEKYKDAIATRLISSETKITFELPGCPAPITVIIDLVLQKGSSAVEVIDFKFGKGTKTFSECREDIQVRTCSLAARKFFIENGAANGFPGIKNVFLTFDYFRKKPITLAFTPKEDEETANFLIRKGQEIKNNKSITRIAKDNNNFHWSCKNLCDIETCKKMWKGNLKLDENDEVIT